MAKLTSKTAFTAPALIIAAATISACSAQSYGHNSSFAGANCHASASQSCAGRYGHSAHSGAQAHAGHSGGEYTYGGQSYGAKKSRYGTHYQTAGYQQEYYPQFSPQPQMMFRPAPQFQPSFGYQAASTSFETPSVVTQQMTTPANCPAGTTAQSDGTCLQGSSISSQTASYTAPAPSYSSGYITGSTATNCPAGTSASNDGSCLMGGTGTSHSSSSYTGPSYSSSASSSGVAPALSTYDWGSKDTTWGSPNYVSPGTRIVDMPNSYPSSQQHSSATSSRGYMPSRK